MIDLIAYIFAIPALVIFLLVVAIFIVHIRDRIKTKQSAAERLNNQERE